MKNETRLRARKAVNVIRRESLTIMATWKGNLYKRCLEGVAEFERLRPRVKPATEPARYCSLMGQQAAGQFAAASLDNVLTVLIGETADDKWQYDIVTDIPGVCFGSPIGRPLASREEAEKRALGGLALLGAPLQPADDYEPEDLDGRKPIRVNRSVFGVATVTYEQLEMPVLKICRDLGLTSDELQIIFARMLLDDAAGHPVRWQVLTSLTPDQAKNVALGVAGVRFAQSYILGRLRHLTFFSLAECNAAIREVLDANERAPDASPRHQPAPAVRGDRASAERRQRA